MFGIRKQLWKELTMLEATVKELASHTKEQIDGLRNDMAAEFVKRDKDIDLHWGKIQNVGFEFDHFKLQEEAARHRFEGAVNEKIKNLKEELADLQKLFQGWAGDLSGIDKRLEDFEKRLKNIEEYVSMQTDVVAAIILACGLREDGKLGKAYGQIQREREKLSQIIAKARGKAEEETSLKHEAPAEPALEAEETLFSDLDKYIDSAEARQMLGWKSLSTTMLRTMNIRYQQPKGRYHRLTVHKGDCEKFISNRIVRKKKN